ncbi:DUF952 domain-containing protein [Yinghuangia sp. YIM S09857]|uniref:DUF952 domain-containing protein n=1 Tax=Yinghuangia sp. YIM S09857 TaxID=3436929 RepID=UPI003F5318FD
MDPSLIYKLLSTREWESAEAAGVFGGSEVDREDGFIHFSTASQLGGTARRHFGGRTGLTLLAVDADRLGDGLRWEPSRGGELFPHLYGDLPAAAVTWAAELPDAVLGEGEDREGSEAAVARAVEEVLARL